MRATRLAPLAALIALFAAPLTTVAAAAAPAAPERSEPVLLTLTPHDRGLLRAVAAGRAPAHSHRAASLARALATPADQNDVVASAKALGLTVRHVTRLAVLATGPASVVNSLFGSARAVAPHSRFAHPLPHIPTALAGRVTAAFGGDDNRPAFRHFATAEGTADGTDLRTAYGNGAPDPRTNTGVRHAIATVQLSDWRPSDLTHFAADLGSGWPAPSYTGIDDAADPSSIATSTSSPDFGNDMEVDLDQEAMYAVDPFARQRAYTSANDLIGMYDSLIAIGDDASDPTVDNHIVAASISWGQCEAELETASDPTALFNAFEDALSYVLATGVTVFAATGDSGAYCGDPSKDPRVSPSYPASSPQVIAVGGTSASTPGDRTTQVGWADGHGASGGGFSGRFTTPSWQSGVDPTDSSGRRTTPDISALAGQPGFELYSTSLANDPAHQTNRPGYTIAGGTSLASPIAAATFAAELARHGYGWGIGDIHPGLYAQRTDTTAFFDVASSGSNGTDTARAGYDRVTGIGTPIWSRLMDSGSLGGQPHFAVTKAFINTPTVGVSEHQAGWQSFTGFRIDSDTTTPHTVCQAGATYSPATPSSFTFPAGTPDGVHDLTLTAVGPDGTCHFADAFVFLDRAKPSLAAKLAIAGGATRNVVATWQSRDANGDNGSGVRRIVTTLTGAGHTWHPTRSGARVTGVAGRPFALKVTAYDYAGNSSTTTARLLDDRSFSFSRAWSRARTRSAFGGSQAGTSHRGAFAKFSATGKAYVLYVSTCSSCGKLGVYTRAGHLLTVVDTYAARTHYRVAVTILTSTSYRGRTLVVRALGKKRTRSTGTRVVVDGMATRG